MGQFENRELGSGNTLEKPIQKSRFTESQIVAIYKEADSRLKVAEVCRAHGIRQSTFYNWKSKYGGLDVSEMRQIKKLESEHVKLKRI